MFHTRAIFLDQHTYGLNWLRLNQLADSALPIGAAAHSFGLESLVEDGALKVENLMPLLHDYLLETGTLESAYCRAAHAIVPPTPNPSPVKREGLKNGISPSPRKEGKG